MAQEAGTLIIGGGIWGVSTAYHLAQAGHEDVCVLERNEKLVSETTSQAAGLVGQIRGTPLMRKAIQYAIDLFSRFEHDTGHDPGFRQVGSLLIALTSERMESFEEQVEHANDKGVEAEFMEPTEMARLVPALDASQVLGGYFVPKDGYLDPTSCAQAYAAAAKDQGVGVRTGTQVTGLLVHDGQVAGVETTRGFIEAEHVVVTAGPWTGDITKMVGVVPPMQPIRHQRVTTVPVEGIPAHHPVVRVTDASCYVRPERGGYLYGYFEPNPVSYEIESLSSEFRTADIDAPVEVMAEARDRLVPIFPILRELEIADHNQGLTTFAPDGNYLVGQVPDAENLYIATGCASLGIAGSAAVGRWLANWLTTGDPGEDLSKVDPQRFGDRASDREWVRQASEEFYGAYYSIESMSVS